VPGPPRKLIWVVGEASAVPGSGETVMGFAAAAAASEAGTVFGGDPTLEEPQAPSARAASATARQDPISAAG
jgi:hypothetical protein